MKAAFLIATAIVISFWALHRSQADPGQHFHCSVCGSHNHGSIWHDTDKDGKRDR